MILNSLKVLAIFRQASTWVFFYLKLANLSADSDHFWTYPKNFKHLGDQILERFQGVFKLFCDIYSEQKKVCKFGFQQ